MKHTSFPKVKTAKKPKTYTTMKPNQTEGSTGVENEAENLLVEMSVTMNNLCRFYDQKDDRAMKITMDKAYELSHKGIAHLMELDKANEKLAACLAALKELKQATYDYGDQLQIWIEEDRFRDWPGLEVDLIKQLMQQGESAIERAKTILTSK